ncbi:hypothetical protein EMIT0P43_90222 [Pseudomonas jessenii]
MHDETLRLILSALQMWILRFV